MVAFMITKRSASALSFVIVVSSTMAASAFQRSTQQHHPLAARNYPASSKHRVSSLLQSRQFKRPTHLQSSSYKESTRRTDSGVLSVFSDTPIAPYLDAPRFGLSEKNMGFLALFSVPVVWGTYVPVVRVLYESDPPVPGVLFSAAYFAVASLSTLALLIVFPNLDRDDSSHGQAAHRDALALEQEQSLDDSALSTYPQKDFWSKLNTLHLPIGGIEIGTYLFLGATMQVMGLKTIPADRAGFLVQLSTIFVPLVEGVMKGNPSAISMRTWGACGLALAGIGIMSLDLDHQATSESLEGAIQASTQMASFSNGDFLTVGAALMYTMSIIRLSKFSQESSPLRITASKATVEMILAASLVAAAVWSVTTTGAVDATSTNAIMSFVHDSGNEIVQFSEAVRERWADGTLPLESIFKVGAATLYTGWVATAFLVFAQSYGQQRVKATDANLIYSLQPLFTSFFAFLMLGEVMAPIGYVGGSFIGGAVFMVASKPSEEDEPCVKEV